MPARKEPRFFVDDAIWPVGMALDAVRGDVLYPGHARLPEVPLETLDPVWMPIVGAMGLVVISRDKHFATRPGEQELYRLYGLRSIWVAGSKDPPMSNWHYLRRLLRHWDEIEARIAALGAGPWACAAYESGVKDRKTPGR